ncbi:hypothetical protein A2678_03335 [Candidatus Kaiserbacteria bacterium RIFCSPHIGHO2_01_FULL_53_31]|uniref:Uncharacterized protein n=1 Tax=Candidatus Kaiserbacteria bacterium RIFCSPHIGHO2_01_FULL_53_31 TaxID=1798481 RepID=A0A1F6CH11_9BACT|nr:MAG: hypothetical protein A2678_03335 [Candidatus Kaiserbacteria bacterium RIFCSPHIGHO2_01_FULL_53_31]
MLRLQNGKSTDAMSVPLTPEHQEIVRSDKLLWEELASQGLGNSDRREPRSEINREASPRNACA